MKKLIVLALSLISMSIYAQDNVKHEKDEPEYSAKKVIVSEVNNSLHLVGNVSFSTPFLKIRDAEKIIWDKNLNELIITGSKSFEIDGSVVIDDKVKKNTMRYRIGERIIYLE